VGGERETERGREGKEREKKKISYVGFLPSPGGSFS
jgi:hypothetical protein